MIKDHICAKYFPEQLKLRVKKPQGRARTIGASSNVIREGGAGVTAMMRSVFVLCRPRFADKTAASLEQAGGSVLRESGRLPGTPVRHFLKRRLADLHAAAPPMEPVTPPPRRRYSPSTPVYGVRGGFWV